MNIFKRLKPVKSAIDLSALTCDQVIYCCKTSVLNKVILGRQGKQFNKALSDEMESGQRFYFVVTNKLKYGIVSGALFEPWLQQQIKTIMSPDNKSVKNAITTVDILPPDKDQPAARDAFNHYIKSIQS